MREAPEHRRDQRLRPAREATPYSSWRCSSARRSSARQDGRPLPAASRREDRLQIAAACGAAHDAGIVHRDLKPENVFLVGGPDRDEGRRAHRRLRGRDDPGAGRSTKMGIVFGTPHYMSPEQAAGQPVDHRADIYALGVIMYVMFTGRVPFVADTYMGVLTQHMYVKPSRPARSASGRRSARRARDHLAACAREEAGAAPGDDDELARHRPRRTSRRRYVGRRAVGGEPLAIPRPVFKLPASDALPSASRRRRSRHAPDGDEEGTGAPFAGARRPRRRARGGLSSGVWSSGSRATRRRGAAPATGPSRGRP